MGRLAEKIIREILVASSQETFTRAPCGRNVPCDTSCGILGGILTSLIKSLCSGCQQLFAKIQFSITHISLRICQNSGKGRRSGFIFGRRRATMKGRPLNSSLLGWYVNSKGNKTRAFSV